MEQNLKEKPHWPITIYYKLLVHPWSNMRHRKCQYSTRFFLAKVDSYQRQCLFISILFNIIVILFIEYNKNTFKLMERQNVVVYKISFGIRLSIRATVWKHSFISKWCENFHLHKTVVKIIWRTCQVLSIEHGT